MKRKSLLVGLFVLATLAGCGSDAEFGYLFDFPNRSGGNPDVVQGIWRLDGSTASQEVRAEVGQDYLIVAGKCVSGGREVITGAKVSAQITATTISHSEAIEARKMDGDFGCQLRIPAGSYSYTKNAGRARLARLGVSFTKIADLKK